MNQIPNPRWMGPRYKHMSDAAAPYSSITVEKLPPIIGAEIGGVDIGNPSEAQMDETDRALAENLVIFFRDQSLTPEQHLGFGMRFGELHIHPAAPTEGDHPGLMVIKADRDSPRANGEGWHSDVSCDEEPPMGSILYIKECPPVGGDTLFANMYAAYEALSDRMKVNLEGLTAVHDGEENYRGTYANFGIQDKPNYPRAVHPVIRTHPVTGQKALFTKRILGIPVDESTGLLAYLFEHMANPTFQCRRADSTNPQGDAGRHDRGPRLGPCGELPQPPGAHDHPLRAWRTGAELKLPSAAASHRAGAGVGDVASDGAQLGSQSGHR